MIALSAENIRDIISHAESDYPNECGGLLLGRFEGDERAVLKTLRMKNIAAEETQHDRVLIDTQLLSPGTYYVQGVVNGSPVRRPVILTGSGIIGG